MMTDDDVVLCHSRENSSETLQNAIVVPSAE